MINLKHKRCQVEGCNITNPTFDIKGGKGRFCLTHKTTDMIDVKHPICNYDGCKIRPSFGKLVVKQNTAKIIG